MKAYIIIALMIIAGLSIYGIQSFAQKESGKEGNMDEINKDENRLASATFAGGCFWCTESDFEKVDGVVEVISGYTGGDKEKKDSKVDTMEGAYSKPSDEVLKAKLTPLHYRVTQKDDTERAFDNEYWDNKREGIYVDIVSEEPLFSSLDKYDSGTGWPSFTRPLEPENIVEKEDRSFFSVRTEVRSKYGDSHLGHLFNDGPKPTGLRYCMNSAALRFIPKEDLEKEGYGKYLEFF